MLSRLSGNGEICPRTFRIKVSEVDRLAEWNIAWPVLSEGGLDENGKPRLKLVSAGLYWAVKRLTIELLNDF